MQVNKSISQLLARNRLRNDSSNRSEFLYPHPSKRRRIDGTPDPSSLNTGSCARTDAKPIDRDVMMKYDIAKNEEGPLRRTTNANANANTPGNASGLEATKCEAGEDASANMGVGVGPDGKESVTAERYPPLDERLKNLETHLAVRYGAYALQCLLSEYLN